MKEDRGTVPFNMQILNRFCLQKRFACLIPPQQNIHLCDMMHRCFSSTFAGLTQVAPTAHASERTNPSRLSGELGPVSLDIPRRIQRLQHHRCCSAVSQANTRTFQHQHNLERSRFSTHSAPQGSSLNAA